MVSADQVRFEIEKAANDDPAGCAIELPQDPGQAGKDQAQQLPAMLAGYDVRKRRSTGSKEVRATGYAAQQQAGNVLSIGVAVERGVRGRARSVHRVARMTTRSTRQRRGSMRWRGW